MDVVFYQLERQPLERALPALLEKSLERGWRAIVEVSSPQRQAALDDALWTYAERSFLPHGVDGEPDCETQPILITAGTANNNDANIRFLVDGTRFTAELAGYARIAIMFDGDNPDAKTAARDDWKLVKASGIDATFWQQNQDGRWEKKA